MKLQQSQVWKLDAEYLRIIRVERLEVDYLAMKSLATGKPTRHKVSKKVFCRLLKTATLLSEEDVQDHKNWPQPPPPSPGSHPTSK